MIAWGEREVQDVADECLADPKALREAVDAEPREPQDGKGSSGSHFQRFASRTERRSRLPPATVAYPRMSVSRTATQVTARCSLNWFWPA